MEKYLPKQKAPYKGHKGIQWYSRFQILAGDRGSLKNFLYSSAIGFCNFAWGFNSQKEVNKIGALIY
jgi:hypothetical protein